MKKRARWSVFFVCTDYLLPAEHDQSGDDICAGLSSGAGLHALFAIIDVVLNGHPKCSCPDQF
ncbi:hypothetical protein TALK_10630 [Thalassospira alkalitolerans]|uniref:Uncharacterized protein n=1 Tax=Thalassospira alkalitolerans TaxID=1293890 RepID=A0A1Y2LCA1_9PROT|nr:hypothetical protein TALK_10630 [Thalassospira alkalitolerans]